MENGNEEEKKKIDLGKQVEKLEKEIGQLLKEVGEWCLSPSAVDGANRFLKVFLSFFCFCFCFFSKFRKIIQVKIEITRIITRIDNNN